MKSFSLNKKNAFWKVGISALILFAIAGFWLWTRPPSALERATKIAAVPSWSGENHRDTPYFWLSNGDLLFIKPDMTGNDSLYRNIVGKAPAAFYSSKAVKPPGLRIEDFESKMFSSDGEWVAFAEYKKSSFVVTAWRNADGFHRDYSFDGKPSSGDLLDLFWSIDGKTLFCILPKGDIHRFRPSIDEKEMLEIEKPSAQSSHAVSDIIGFAKSGRFIIKSDTIISPSNSEDNEWRRSKIELFEVGYGADKTYSKINSFKFIQDKNESSIPALALSPKGDRLFLGVASVRRNPFLAWLHERISQIPEGAYCVEQGWVMNLDGSGKHLIGEYTVSMEEGKEFPWIIQPKWTPDGKKISFLYDDGVYAIPAD